MVTVFNGLRDAHQKDAAENRKVIADLRREVLELKERTLADERVADAEEAGTRKGRSFEELVHADDRARSPRARGTQRTTSVTSPRRQEARRATRSSRSGAALGGALATVVFEAKNKRLSKNDAWSELNACMARARRRLLRCWSWPARTRSPPASRS